MNIFEINFLLWLKVILINITIIMTITLATAIFNTSKKDNYFTKGIILLVIYIISYIIIYIYVFKIQLKNFFYYFTLPSFLFILIGLLLRKKRNTIKHNIKSPYKKAKYEFVLNSDFGKIKFGDPFDNFLIYAGANSGKTVSLGKPLLEQYFINGFAGLVFDYKEKDYTYFIASLKEKYPNYPHEIFYIDFKEIKHRFNLIKPILFNDISDLLQIIEDILNAQVSDKEQENIWVGASKEIVKAVTVKFFLDYPRYCTIPHIFNFILRRKIKDIISICKSNVSSSGYLESIEEAISSEKTLASVLFTLKIMLSKIANNQKICYVLSGDDFDFNPIEPKQGKLICLANNRSQEDLISPIISSMVSLSSRAFSLENEIPFVYFLDEGTTFKIKKFETLPSVLREYKVSFTLLTQSGSKIIIQYDKDSKSSIESNFGNHFFGKTKDMVAAQNYIKVFQKQIQDKHSSSRGKSKGNITTGNSITENKDLKYETADFTNLEAGVFIGSALNSNYKEFKVRFKMVETKNAEKLPIIRNVTDWDIESNYKNILKNIFDIQK